MPTVPESTDGLPTSIYSNSYDPPSDETVPAEPIQNSIYDNSTIDSTALEVGRTNSEGYTPDHSARILKLEMRTGLPSIFIQENLDDIERETARQDFSPDQFRQTYPKFTEWLAQNPQHYAFAKEDLNFFGKMEKMGSAFSTGWKSIPKQEELAEILTKEMDYGLTESEIKRRDELKESAKQEQIAASKAPTREELSGLAGSTIRQFGSSIKEGGLGAAVGGVAGAVVGALTPVPGATALGLKTGFSLGSFKYTYQQETAFAFDEFRDLKDIEGNPIDKETIKGVARGVGVINGVIETASDLFVAKLIPGVNKLVGGATKPAINAAVKKALAVPATRSIMLGAAKKMVGGAAVEGMEEFVQALVSVAGRETAQGVSGQTFEPDDLQADLQGATKQAYDAFRGTLVGLGPLIGGGHIHEQRKAVRNAENTTNFYKALGEGTTESKTFKSLPIKAQEALKGILADGPYEKAYIDVEAWDVYWQSKELDPKVVAAEVLGDGGKSYDEASANGQDLIIPTEKYAEKIAPTEHNAALSEDIRRAPEEMSAREWKQVTELEEANVLAQGQKTTEVIQGPTIEETEKELSEAKQLAEVSDRIAAQLKGTAFEQQAKEYSKLFAERYKTRAERRGLGETPLQAYEKSGISIREGLPIIEGKEVLNQNAAVVLDEGTTDYEKGNEEVRTQEKRIISGLERGDVGSQGYVRALPSLTTSIEGLPKGSPGPNLAVHRAAKDYSNKSGNFYSRQKSYATVDVERSKRIANEYEKLTHNPNDPQVQAAYQALIQEITAQYQEIVNSGLVIERIEPGMANPYSSSADLFTDIKNGHMWFLPTEQGFGSGDHPLLAVTSETIDGKPLLANDVFRIVHDFYGHAKEGVGFGPNGEENAWQSHVRMFSPLAARAMTTETRGQNSWVNFGPHGEANRNNPTDTIYAEHKAALMPEWVSSEGLDETTDILFQNDKNDPRGFFDPKSKTIGLLEKANLSTILHEGSHAWMFELIEDATTTGTPQQLRDDLDTILEWMGLEVRSKDGAEAIRKAVKKEHHEKWAEGAEHYFMTGKAPTTKLQSLFNTFKIWMTWIYKKLSLMGVKFTPEVSAVMDRLIATDAEIGIVSAQANYPMSPELLGLKGQKAEDYLTAIAEVEVSAKEELATRMMKDLKRQNDAFYKEREDEVRVDVAAEVNEMPVYRALDTLGKVKDSNGQLIRLSKKALTDEFGKGVTDQLPRNIYTTKPGITHDEAAEMFRFDSGSQMLTAIVNAVPKSDLINVRTAERMQELYPDILLSPEDLRSEALKAVHNEDKAKVLRLQLEHLFKMFPAVSKDIVRRIVRRVPTDKQVKDYALKIIGQVPTKDLKPHLYLRAERKAAKAASEALTKGDVEKAFMAKRQELINHEAYKASLDAQEFMEKSLQQFKRVMKKDETLSKTRDMDLVQAARAILADHGLGQKEKSADQYLENISKYGDDTYLSVKAIVDDATLNAGDFKTVPYDQFVKMTETVNSLWKLSREFKTNEIDGKKIEKDTQVEELNAALEDLMSPNNNKTFIGAKTQWENSKLRLMGYKSSLTRMEHWARTMDLGNPNGPFTKYLFRPIQEGINRYRSAKQKYLKRYLNDILKPIRNDFKKGEIDARELGTGIKFKSFSDLMGAMLHTGNDSNKSKLLRGYKWGELREDGSLDSTKWDAFVNRMQNEGILRKEHYDYLQKVWDLFEEFKPQTQKAHYEMYGYYFNEITANEIITPWGTYKGGYAPAKPDPSQNTAQFGKEELEKLEKNGNSYRFPTTGRGATKSRVESFAAPLTLDISLVPMHIDWALRFTHIEPSVKQVGKIVIDKKFRSALDSVDPTIGTDLLIPWLQRAATQMVSTPSTGYGGKFLDNVSNALRKRSGLQALMFNVVNTLQQFTGLSISAIRVKPYYLKNAFFQYIKSPKQVVSDISDKSEFMASRFDNQIFEMMKELDDIQNNPGKFDKMRDYMGANAYILQQHTQNIVDAMTWSGAYNQAVANGASELNAVREADSVVRTTQGTFNPEDVSKFESGSPFVRLFTMFTSYFNMQANLLQSEITIIARDVGLKKGASRLFYTYMMGFAIPAFLSELLVQATSGDFDDDDDDEYLDSVLQAIFMGQFRNATALFPGFGTLATAMYNQTNDKLYDDRVSTSPVINTLDTSVGLISDINKISDGQTVAKKKLIRDSLTAIGLISGLPAGVAARPLGYLADIEEGKAEPENILEFTRGLITGKSGK